MLLPTNTDTGGPHDWWVKEPVCQLREWAKNDHWLLPETGHGTIGSLADNWLQLHDSTRFVSKYHASVSCSGSQWSITDLDSKNGIRQDGITRLTFPLSSGVEIGIGGVTLVGESPRFVTLRRLVSRTLGWGAERLEDVDLALRAIRTAASRRESLTLCGAGDLMLLARHLHRITLGDERPFVVCDPRRRRAESTARSAANYDSGMVALEAAGGGTLCIWQDRQPDDFDAVRAAVKEPSSRAQLVVCTHELDRGQTLTSTPVVIPELSEREPEIDAIIDAYGCDAVATLGGVLVSEDHEWIREVESSTLAHIEIAVWRLVALRVCDGKITPAAALLQMSHAALSEWVARRSLPIYASARRGTIDDQVRRGERR